MGVLRGGGFKSRFLRGAVGFLFDAVYWGAGEGAATRGGGERGGFAGGAFGARWCCAGGEKTADLPLERLRDHVVVAQTAKALAALVDEAVVAARLGTAHAARPAHLEPLCRGLVCLHLRHDAPLSTAPLGRPGVPRFRGK